MSQPTFLNKDIKIDPNWFKTTLMYAFFSAFLFFIVFIFDWTQIASFWENNWDKLIASLGSIATAIAVGITSYDLQKRYKFEKNKFEFESDAFIVIDPINYNTGNSYMLMEINEKNEKEIIKSPIYNLISINNSKFCFQNNGGMAKNIEISVSNKPSFSDSAAMITNFISKMGNKDSLMFSTKYFDKHRKDIIDWKENFYIQIKYENMYNRNITIEKYFAKVQLVTILRDLYVYNQTTKVVTEIKNQESSEFYISIINEIDSHKNTSQAEGS